jgi:SPOR domain
MQEGSPMIRRMGSFAFRLWIIVMVSAPVCIYLMPIILQFFPGISPAIAGGFLCVIFGGVIGACFDLTGRKLIHGMIKEGEAWERAGIFSRAEKTYANAVRVYDSFLLSPLFGKKIAVRLTGTLARFSLTAGIETPHLKIASAVYLKSSPGDETLATLWLGQLKKEGLAGAIDQEVLTVLADVHYTHKKLILPLAEVLLDLGRMDYPAKRVYRTLLDPELELEPEIKSDFRNKIHALLGEPGEVLETLGNNIAGRVVATSPNPIGVNPLDPDGIAFGQHFLSRFSAVFTIAAKGGKFVGSWVASGLKFCIRFFGQAIALIRKRERVRFYIRVGVMGFLSVWLLFFMGSTISHILRSRAQEKEPRMIEIRTAKPFTIQVAAYSKQSHADRYAKILSKKGISPLIKKVTGGGKIWYVVRISEFPDKVSAAAFGKKLKAEKIIEDFFVSNK